MRTAIWLIAIATLRKAGDLGEAAIPVSMFLVISLIICLFQDINEMQVKK